MIAKAMIKAIEWYKNSISPRLPGRCRFTPTCSEYAADAVRIHGAFVGFFLALFRILRCNQLFKGGYDPVPEKRAKL